MISSLNLNIVTLGSCLAHRVAQALCDRTHSLLLHAQYQWRSDQFCDYIIDKTTPFIPQRLFADTHPWLAPEKGIDVLEAQRPETIDTFIRSLPQTDILLLDNLIDINIMLFSNIHAAYPNSKVQLRYRDGVAKLLPYKNEGYIDLAASVENFQKLIAFCQNINPNIFIVFINYPYSPHIKKFPEAAARIIHFAQSCHFENVLHIPTLGIAQKYCVDRWHFDQSLYNRLGEVIAATHAANQPLPKIVHTLAAFSDFVEEDTLTNEPPPLVGNAQQQQPKSEQPPAYEVSTPQEKSITQKEFMPFHLPAPTPSTTQVTLSAPPPNLENVSLVVRSVGERTTATAVHLLSQCLPGKNIDIISAVPFSAALRQSFESGIKSNKEWTFIIDADVLLTPTFLAEQLARAAQAPANVFCLQGLVFDKFFHVFRPAGNRLFRTELLRTALSAIPGEGTTLRPESTTVKSMAQKGFQFMQTPYIVGLHDFEQHYLDIAKKCFLQAHKHTSYLPEVMQLWQKWQQGDSDFTAALIGAQIGLAYQEKVFVDNNFLTEKVRNAAESVGLARKKPLIPQSYSFAKVCSTIASAGKTPECHKMQALLLPSERWDTCSAQ